MGGSEENSGGGEALAVSQQELVASFGFAGAVAAREDLMARCLLLAAPEEENDEQEDPVRGEATAARNSEVFVFSDMDLDLSEDEEDQQPIDAEVTPETENHDDKEAVEAFGDDETLVSEEEDNEDDEATVEGKLSLEEEAKLLMEEDVKVEEPETAMAISLEVEDAKDADVAERELAKRAAMKSASEGKLPVLTPKTDAKLGKSASDGKLKAASRSPSLSPARLRKQVSHMLERAFSKHSIHPKRLHMPRFHTNHSSHEASP
ncbi:Hypothetical Protein FCC1311_072892 [Hondaea fermentalgiana]|uniref:Uncharacterized protein n=1 Tax=Hondaea fermentalgiana TaxID=2315210 RepID=A0A2R5GMW4_9STRA|nr:Hypothetical Protein FCC1311_072892 [Hondaea fermentalgiana]|eukprot:GBG31068.1 Hypothetical Protein FCC1311_072892 [Hondaea fermentalgiana]